MTGSGGGCCSIKLGKASSHGEFEVVISDAPLAKPDLPRLSQQIGAPTAPPAARIAADPPRPLPQLEIRPVRQSPRIHEFPEPPDARSSNPMPESSTQAVTPVRHAGREPADGRIGAAVSSIPEGTQN